jgi:hypothetical protein
MKMDLSCCDFKVERLGLQDQWLKDIFFFNSQNDHLIRSEAYLT